MITPTQNSTEQDTSAHQPVVSPYRDSTERAEVLKAIDSALGRPCVLVDPATGTLERVSSHWPRIDLFRWLPLCSHVARCQSIEVIEEHAPLMLLAVPIEATEESTARVAVSVLLTEEVNSLSEIESAAKIFGVEPELLFAWATRQPVWPATAALRLVETVVENQQLRFQSYRQKKRITDVSGRLISTFEELNLLHRLTEQLSLEQSARDICEEVVGWLSEVLPASCLVARWFTQETEGFKPSDIESAHGRTIVAGSLPFTPEEIDGFFNRLGPEATYRALILDRSVTGSPTWCYPTVNELICVPIRTDDRLVGWIAAINSDTPKKSNAPKLGAVQASLLTSVCTILGVHAGNRVLFHRQENLLDSAVRAITSAIDAKDSYTCGHSDRVARIAVQLAKHIGCPEEEQNDIYMGGLLHDVGKIGIDDQVLCKPGKLTDEEYDHIKEHPRLGAKIVEEVPELQHILPIVLHHHEAWDGSGYPDGLVATDCPLQARIMAVADAFDAMGSDRPYRKGMSFGKIDAILKDGSGKQWDPEIVEAYFNIRTKVHAIAMDGRCEEEQE